MVSEPLCIHDGIYGTTCWDEPLFIELYHSAAVQRLQRISQGGITAFIKPERRATRLDHGIGVAALLRRLGADPLEQVAGLLHDVAHTAFSHVVDFVFPNAEHAYHEHHRAERVAGSDLPELVGRYGLDWNWLTDAENFALLEQPLPELCADRLDYFLRDGALDVGLFTVTEAHRLMDHLCVVDHRIVVDDLSVARWLGERFIELDDRVWCSVQEVGWYAVMACALRVALDHGVIVEQDFAKTDTEVWEAVSSAPVPEIRFWLALLRRDVDFVRDEAHADLEVLPKVRSIDPPVLLGGDVLPLSKADPAFAAYRKLYLLSKQGPWKLRIVQPETPPAR